MNAKLKRQLDEHYAAKEAISIWHGPQNPAFTSLIARVKSFEDADWPETYSTPISLAEAGFSTTVNYLLFSNIFNIESYIRVIYLFSSCVCYRMDQIKRVFSLQRLSCRLAASRRAFSRTWILVSGLCLRAINKGAIFLSRVFKGLQRTTPHH
jgi:hypothetical protein